MRDVRHISDMERQILPVLQLHTANRSEIWQIQIKIQDEDGEGEASGILSILGGCYAIFTIEIITILMLHGVLK